MKNSSMNIVILGLSITSSWGNGHATTYRSLVKGLYQKGHRVLFLERDVPWYASNRDLPSNPYCRTELYNGLEDLRIRFASEIKEADLVIVGSYVPEGVEVGKFIIESASNLKAFYDIDTPVTLSKLAKNDFEYITPALIKDYDLYLSFAGGPILKKIEDEYSSPAAKPLYCSFDPDNYYEEDMPAKWDLGYLGTFSVDRQPKVKELLLRAAGNDINSNFVIAGPNYPDDLTLGKNVERIYHLPPREHKGFYNSQRFTLNITREDMVESGYSPSVRLFEAAACGTPIISDYWKGLEEYFELEREILIADTYKDTLSYLKLGNNERKKIGRRAKEKVLALHTSLQRAEELEKYCAVLTRV